MHNSRRLIVTCEHGGRRIPARLRPLFVGEEAVVLGHRGHDTGALALARKMARVLGAALFVGTVSRLVVDLNRSPRNPRRFSAVTRRLPPGERREIEARFYHPYRQAVEEAVKEALREGAAVLHLAVHSFTPVLEGRTRRADVGFLYDPAREGERALCGAWAASLRRLDPALVLRRNYPYRGTSDGFTAHLRKRHGGAPYLGLELEVNQKFPLGEGRRWSRLQRRLAWSLREALGGSPSTAIRFPS